ncbi:MAG TPA: hypothetical protein G4O10_00835 [Dehalococcoidia bacterium]|nr:hypothetical protein [Dehalococcoidia bacterium]
MQALKTIGLVFISFFLFIFLIVFSVAFTANGTALNPKFITKELDQIDVSPIAIEMMEEEFEDDPDFPEELKEALYDTIEETEPVIKAELNEAIISVGDYLRGKTDELELKQILGDTFLNSDFLADLLDKVDLPALVEASIDTDEIDMDEEFLDSLIDTVAEIEPDLKEQVVAASDPIFKYLLAETDDIDLVDTLRSTLLSTEFTTTLIDNLDIVSLASEFLEDSISDEIPEDMDFLIDELDNTIATLEPSIKEAMSDTDQILDYLLGERQDLRIVISLEPVHDDLEAILRQAFLDNIPQEWEDWPQAEIDEQLEQFLARAIPETFEFDEELLGTELPDRIDDGLTEAEEALTEARDGIHDALSEVENTPELEDAEQYIGWFTMGYWGLIALIVVLILAIIAIYHHVKGASLHLGIMFLIIGIIECVVVYVGRSIAIREIAKQDIPAAVQDLPDQLIPAVTGPLAALSIGLIVLGVILIAASIIYPRWRLSETD